MGVFSKRDKPGIDQQSITTLISTGSLVDGSLKAKAFARIDGQVNGDVSIDEGLILGEMGIIEGDVVTGEMVIYGTVNGNINVRSIEIRATGKVTGNIKTGSLAVETGGIYNGKLIMTAQAAK